MSKPDQDHPEYKALVRSRLVQVFEQGLVKAERDILAGIEGATVRACMYRDFLERSQNPPVPPPPKPEMTAAEYFELYGLPAQGRA